MTTTAPIPAQLGQVPPGFLFTPDQGVNVLRLASRLADGSHLAEYISGPSAGQSVTLPPSTGAMPVLAMPDEIAPATHLPPAIVPPPVTPDMVTTNIPKITTQLATAASEAAAASAVQAAFPGAAPVPPTGMSAPVREAALRFDGYMALPEHERTIGQMFQLAAYRLAQDLPDGMHAVLALDALWTAREHARAAALPF